MQVVYESPKQPGIHYIVADVDVLEAGASAVVLPNYFTHEVPILFSCLSVDKTTTVTVFGCNGLGQFVGETILFPAGGAIANTETTNKFTYVTSIQNIGTGKIEEFSVIGVGEHYIVDYPEILGTFTIVDSSTLEKGNATILPNILVNPEIINFSWSNTLTANVRLEIRGIDSSGSVIHETINCNTAEKTATSTSKYYHIISISNPSNSVSFSDFTVYANGLYYDVSDRETYVTQKPYIVMDTLFADGFNVQFVPLPIVSQDTLASPAVLGKTFDGYTTYVATGTIQNVYNVPKFSGPVTGPMTLVLPNEVAWPNTVTGATDGTLNKKEGVVYSTVYPRPLAAIKVEVQRLFGKLAVYITPFGA